MKNRTLSGIVAGVLAVGNMTACRTFPREYDYEIEMEKNGGTYKIFVDNDIIAPQVWVYRNGWEIKDSQIKDEEISKLVKSLREPYNGCIVFPHED